MLVEMIDELSLFRKRGEARLTDEELMRMSLFGELEVLSQLFGTFERPVAE
jgi:hypothetical protein